MTDTVWANEFNSNFKPTDYVFVDFDEKTPLAVTGILFRNSGQFLELSWFHNGDSKSAWVEAFRCKKVDA